MVGDANHTCEMTEAEAIQIMRKHIEGQFPKECPNCHHRYATLREYILATRPVGAKSYDADAGEWRPVEPLGTAVLANCPCGTTLALTSDGVPLLQMWRVMRWAWTETRRRGLTPQQLLDHVRAVIRRQVLAEPGPGPGKAPEGK
jgi:hypothetical protein